MKKINTSPRSDKLDVKKQTIRQLSEDKLKAIAGGNHSVLPSTGSHSG